MCHGVKKGKVFYGQEPPSGESTTTECLANYHLLAVITEAAQYRELLVAVNHNQLRTMASETVDPIDWSHPTPYTGQYPLSASCILLISATSAGIERATAACEATTLPMRHSRYSLVLYPV